MLMQIPGANHVGPHGRKAVLLLRELEHVHNRLANATAAEVDRASAVSAALEAIDSHARVRRLAAHLLDGDDLVAVKSQLQELWKLIQGQSRDRPHSGGAAGQ